MAGNGKVAAGGAVAGVVAGLVVHQVAKLGSEDRVSSDGTVGRPDVVKVGPSLNRGIVEQIQDVLLMDVVVGVPLIAFILVGAIIALAMFNTD